MARDYKQGRFLVLPYWFWFRWTGSWSWWLYGAYANGRILYVGPLEIKWDWPWSHHMPYSEGFDKGIWQEKRCSADKLAAIRAKLEEIVCTDPIDRGVVLLSDDGGSHLETRVIDGAERQVNVYNHKHFSPLGDALIELWEMTCK
jgi:hypothetical protein